MDSALPAIPLKRDSNLVESSSKIIIKTGTVKRAMKTTKKLNDRIITLMWKVGVISERDS